jgi:hypothetical protein
MINAVVHIHRLHADIGTDQDGAGFLRDDPKSGAGLCADARTAGNHSGDCRLHCYCPGDDGNRRMDESGNTRFIFFWGTVYRYPGGNLCVRCLYWDGFWWQWDAVWLDHDWGDDDLAALRAS